MTPLLEYRERFDWKFWGIALLLTLVGLCLRAYRVFDFGFWTDELSALKQSNNWDSIRSYCVVWLSSPPMRYLLTSVLLHTFYMPELIRLPSLVCGTLATPIAMVLAKRWWNSRSALWAGLLFALNPWIVAHSQDGRLLVVALFAILGGACLALPPPNRYPRIALLAAGFCLALASSLNYPGVLLSAGIFTAFVANSWKQPFGKTAKEASLLALPWLAWLILWFGYLAIATPHNPIKNALFPAANASVEEKPEPPAHIELMPLPPRLWTIEFFRFNMRSLLWDGPVRWATLAGVALFVFAGAGRGAPNLPARALIFLVPYLLAVIQQPQQFYPRYGLALLSFALLGLAAGLTWLGRNRRSIGLLFVLVLAVHGPACYRVVTTPPQPWKEALDYIVERWKRTDRLLVGTHQAEFGVFLYNANRIPKQSIVYRVFVGDRLSEETIDNPNRCWLIQWFAFPPFVEGIMQKWYERAVVFPGRYGSVEVWKKKNPDEVEVKEGFDVWGRPIPIPLPSPTPENPLEPDSSAAQ
jgi:4-amino-4-deoxy-L-arabinose transferase-like glycosyltransferase